MCNNKICSASTQNGRCTKFTLDEKCDHCEEHHDTHKELYMKYHNLSIIAYSKNLELKIKDPEKHIKYLYHCYRLFMAVHDARLEHHAYAYDPSTCDTGHLKQIYIMQNKMKYCESEIERRKSEILSRMESSPSHEDINTENIGN